MNPRRILVLVVAALLFFLGLYTWNQRTGQWDALGSNTGLEFSGAILRAFRSASDSVVSVWDHYLALVDVRARNDELERRVRDLEADRARAAEERAELIRLRKLLQLDYPLEWPALGARVMGGRMGSSAGLETLTLSRGYLTGAAPGTPISSWAGLVGRVLKAGPSTSVALLVSDAGSRVAVISSQGRVQGILSGGGPGALLEMRFVRLNARVDVGEILLTSGMDSAYPKGIPVARVTSVSTGGSSMQEIRAVPLVDFAALEEVLLLEHPVGWFAPETGPIYTRHPPDISTASASRSESLPGSADERKALPDVTPPDAAGPGSASGTGGAGGAGEVGQAAETP